MQGVVRHALLILSCAAVSVPVPAWPGQTVGMATGSVVGTVRDATKAVLAGVEAVVSGAPLMGPRRATTNADGEYRFVALPPGDYTVSFSLSDFAALEQQVSVRVGATATVDVMLTVAAQRQAVAVNARTSVDRHSAAAAETFTAAQLDELPSSRSLPGLLTITHALYVPNAEVGGSNGVFNGAVSAYGRSSSPRYTLEGIVVTGLFGFG